MRTNSHDRVLYLDNGPVVGRAGGTDAFALHWEFWMQLCMAFRGGTGQRIGSVVPGTQAADLADLIERSLPDENWQLLLSFWGEDAGRLVRSFVGYLRAGGFVVVDMTHSQGADDAGPGRGEAKE